MLCEACGWMVLKRLVGICLFCNDCTENYFLVLVDVEGMIFNGLLESSEGHLYIVRVHLYMSTQLGLKDLLFFVS